MNTSDSRCGEAHSCTLKQLGWTEEHTQAFSKYTGPYVPGRVACRQKTVWDVFIDGGSVTAGISGALKKLGRFPAVGDFIVLLHQPEAGSSTIVDILPRKSVFTRGTSAKEGTDQVIAANIDIVFIVTAAGHDLNARRIERYLAIAHASGAKPVIVINKSDLTDDPALLTEEIIPVASGIPVIPVSAISGDGITRLEPFLTPGTTIVLIGSSGVGKSTLINRLLDRPIQETSVIRDYDGKGRHTTTVPAALHYEERGTHDRYSRASGGWHWHGISRHWRNISGYSRTVQPDAGSRTAGTSRSRAVPCRKQ